MTSERLEPFVPRLAVELAARVGSHWNPIEGSMLSADISGFTALSERLAGKGKAGAEEITILINTCFEALIGAAYGYGGEVIKFGGDAILVLFRGDEHRRRSANAALAMQAALAASAAARRANLTMTVGAACGPFDVFLVGQDQRELLVTGTAASRVIELEGDADKGQTLVSEDIAQVLPPTMVGGDRAGGQIITGTPEMAETGTAARNTAELPLETFVPASVVQQLDAFAELGGEHRLVTVGFCMVTGIDRAMRDSGQDTTAEALGLLIDGVNQALERYGATALHTDIAGDGFKFVLCAGAPINTGNSSDAMLRAALDIAGLDTPFTITQGVQTGRVFAGFLGSTYRRTYTLMGDVVNTAARMLGKADDRDVIAVADVMSDTRERFTSVKLEPFLVKGKVEPVLAHQVTAIEDDVRHHRNGDVPRFGHGDQLRSVAEAITDSGLVVEITGPPGSGKTRLVEDAIADATGRSGSLLERTVFRATAPQFGVGVPYGLARPLLRTGLGIDTFADATYAGEALGKIVAERAPDLAPMLPLLALPVGAEVAPTPEADAIGEDFRRARVQDLVVELIERTAPLDVLMVVEDVQWADDGSGRLIEHLAAAVSERPWTMLITRRPEDAGPSLPSDATQLLLGPLPDDDIRALAIASAVVPLADEALELVVDRADGNPLFTIEIARSISDGGQAVPDSVEKLLAARIDDLPPSARRVVRLASVLGTAFRRSTLEAVVSTDEVSGLSDPALAGILEATAENEWAFSQTLYRDAAYEGLPFAHRRNLHGRVGDHLEARSGSRVEEIAAILGWHFAEARDHDRAWAYGVIAGDRAMRLSSPVEAIEAYERALKSGRWPKAVTRRQRSRVASLLGDAAERAGRYDVSADAYRAARRLLAPGDHDRLPLFRKHGVLEERQGRYDAAVRWYQRGLKAAIELDHDHPDEPAELAVAIAGIRFRQGLYDQCWDTAVAVAMDTTKAVPARFRAHYICQLVGTLQGRPEAQVHADRALDLAEVFDNPVLVANLYNNLGIGAYYAGRWKEAVDLYQKGYELREASGDLSGSVMSQNNIGEVRSDQGRFAEAEELFITAIRRAEAAGYEAMIHAARSNLGRLFGRQGDIERARKILTDELAAFEAIDAPVFAAEAKLRLLEIDEPGPQLVSAARQLLDEVESSGAGPTVAVPTTRMLAVGLFATGDPGAEQELERAIAQARDENLSFDLYLCLSERAKQADAKGEGAKAERARAEAAELAGLLGIEKA